MKGYCLKSLLAAAAILAAASSYAQGPVISWSTDPIDGHRTGVTASTADNVEEAMGYVKGRTYYAPNGKKFRKGTVRKVASLMLGAQPAMADVKKVGKKGDLVEATDSYARNVLLRQKLAVEANGKTMNDLKLRRANDEKVAEENLEKAKETKALLEKSSVTVRAKTGEGDRLFGSISGKEIADAAKEQLGIDLDRRKIVLDTPIKSIGTMEVTVKLHPQVKAALTVKVEKL